MMKHSATIRNHDRCRFISLGVLLLLLPPQSFAFTHPIHNSIPSSLQLGSFSKYESHRQHNTILYNSNEEPPSDDNDDKMAKSKGDFVYTFMEIAKQGFGTRAKNVAATMSKGDIVVPLCSNLDLRQQLAGRGIYAGVDYKVCEIQDGEALIRPVYPLRKHLERSDWPVPVRPVEDVPLWLSQATYNAGTAVGTLILAFTNLSIAAFIAYFVRFVYVPTESMIPALMPGDVVLISRSAPIPPLRPHVGDVVFFDPPSELDQAIAESSVGKAGAAVQTKGKQFLKRVIATPGETVGVSDSNPVVENSSYQRREALVGSYAHPEVFPPESWNRPLTEQLKSNEYFVAGDNGARSVDSRVWGPLKEKYVIGTVKWVVYPPEHFGPAPPGKFVTSSD